MKIIAIIPVYGRYKLVRYTIERLLNKNGVYKVIVVSDHPKAQKLCESLGVEYVHFMNKPLGAKWNRGFMAAKKHNPDACLFVGSSDWISDNWIPELSPYLRNYDLIGLPGCYLLDIKLPPAGYSSAKMVYRACYWKGYVGPREGESIGIGRLISARVLEKLSWMPFDDTLDNSLDYSMQNRVLKVGGKLKLVTTDKIQSMAVSCNQWPNKHQFEAHWDNRLPSERILPETVFQWFPEGKEVFR